MGHHRITKSVIGFLMLLLVPAASFGEPEARQLLGKRKMPLLRPAMPMEAMPKDVWQVEQNWRKPAKRGRRCVCLETGIGGIL